MKKLLSIFVILSLLASLLLPGMAVSAESAVPHKSEYELSDQSEGNVDDAGNAAGYWMHPFVIGEELSVEFDSPIWMNGFSFYAWCSDFDQFMDIELSNGKGVVVWTGRKVCAGNNLNEVGFDKSFAPGTYTITFINAENPDYPGGENQHFVLGSGYVRFDLEPGDILVTGYRGSNSLGAPQITLYEGEADPNYVDPDPTPSPEPTELPADVTATPEPRGEYPLSDNSDGHFDISGAAAGYWMNPFTIDEMLEVFFPSPIWFSGFKFFAFAPSNDVYLDIQLLDNKDDVVWSGRHVCYGDNMQTVDFDKSFPPGDYTLTFTNAENPNFPEGVNQYWVLGSGYVRADLDEEDVMVTGAVASNTLGAPEITLLEGEADPNYVTPAPTEAPTATPTVPPAETPEATDAPAETEAPAPTEEAKPDKKGCGSFIAGGFAAMAAGLALPVIAMLKKKED